VQKKEIKKFFALNFLKPFRAGLSKKIYAVYLLSRAGEGVFLLGTFLI
jgi:hypothetical protein